MIDNREWEEEISSLNKMDMERYIKKEREKKGRNVCNLSDEKTERQMKYIVHHSVK